MGYADFIAGKTRGHEPCGRDVDDIHETLYPFQRELVRRALRRGRSCLFADCGLGKTLMQLEWARHLDGDVLILAPLAVAPQTAREGKKIGLDVTVCRTGDDVRPGINVTNYEMLPHFDTSEFAGVVLDESSILKAYDGKTRNRILDAFGKTPYRLACSATPAPNDHMELGNHAEFMGAMTRGEMLAMFFVHDGGSVQNWRLKRHATTDFWAWVGSWSDMVRRPSDMGFEDGAFVLPPIKRLHHVVDVDDSVSGTLFNTAPMSIHDRRRARRASLDDRIRIAAAIVAEHPDDKCLVWCDLNDEASGVAKLIPGAVEVKGADTREHKESSMLGFAEPSGVRVLVTKAKIAGHGMNWQACHRMIFVGLSDSYESFYQAVRRCWRFGQTEPVDVHIVTSSLDAEVVHNIERKERQMTEMGESMAANVREAESAQLVMSSHYSETEDSGEEWKMVLGDCVEAVGKMPTDTIDYSVFSPPFASLYTYSDSPRDMGNCAGTPEFMEHFRFLVRDLYRVMKPGRLLSFHCMNLPTTKVRDGFIGIKDFRGDLIRMFEADGFIYHSEVCIWKDPVTAMQRTKALGLLHKQLKKDACMSRQGIADYLVTMRKPGINPDPVTNTDETFPVREWQEYASPVWGDINPSDTLQRTSARAEEDERHICPLQLEVIRRALRMWSNEGDVVLSPFAGIGSEGFVAIQEGRRFVGIELKRSYYDQATENMRAAVATLAQGRLFA